MNGFTFNCLRRAKVSFFRKMYMAIVAVLRPDIVKSEWRKHCLKVQNQLNQEHREQRGFYVVKHQGYLTYGRYLQEIGIKEFA